MFEKNFWLVRFSKKSGIWDTLQDTNKLYSEEFSEKTDKEDTS